MRGQEFTIFRILIGAAFAFSLLLIISAFMANLPNPMTGREAVIDLVMNAARVPGKCFENDIYFQKGETISAPDLEKKCGKDVSLSTGVSAVVCDSDGCFITHKIKLRVSVTCTSSFCSVYFGTSC